MRSKLYTITLLLLHDLQQHRPRELWRWIDDSYSCGFVLTDNNKIIINILLNVWKKNN